MAATADTHPVRLSHRFDVPVDRLFRAWSDATELAAWAWGSIGQEVSAEVDLVVGGRLRVANRRSDGTTWSFSGVYTDVQPGRRIAHTLAWSAPMGYDPVPERVEVDFRADGAGSVIDFVHHGVPDAASAAAHARGWTDAFKALEAHVARSHRGHRPG